MFKLYRLALGRFAAMLIASGALAACGGPTPGIVSGNGPSVVLRPNQQRLVAVSSLRLAPQRHPHGNSIPAPPVQYAADANTGVTSICKPPSCAAYVPSMSCNPGELGNEPGGIAVDREGNLYIPFLLNGIILKVNASCSVTDTLFDPDEFPAGAAIAPDGTVGVTNLCSASCSGAGDIVFYAPGSIYPTGYATGLMSRYYFGDFDKRGNFWNDGLTADGYTAVGLVQHGSYIDRATKISGIGFPGGVQVARNGTVNIDDQECPCIQIYKNGNHVGTVALSGAVDPVGIALDKRNKHVWVADASAAEVNEYAYPAGGKILRSFTGFVQPVGVAALPADTP